MAKLYTNVVAFRVPKPGEGIGDCQDAFAYDLDQQQFALSDGVSRSFLPGVWSQMLVDHFKKDNSIFQIANTEGRINSWLETLHNQWPNSVLKKLGKPVDQLPFYVRNNIHNPAYATLAVLKFTPAQYQGKTILDFEAITIGDTCIFQFQKYRFYKTLPQIDSTGFDNFPQVIASKKNEALEQMSRFSVEVHTECAECADRICLATDALAKWILVQKENKDLYAIEALLSIRDHKEFLNWVIKHREAKGSLKLEGDDTSLMLITIESVEKSPILQPEGWPLADENGWESSPQDFTIPINDGTVPEAIPIVDSFSPPEDKPLISTEVTPADNPVLAGPPNEPVGTTTATDEALGENDKSTSHIDTNSFILKRIWAWIVRASKWLREKINLAAWNQTVLK